jgi:hypothetical protein
MGTPYHHHARIKGVGVDCAQLLCGVYEAAGLVPHIETGHYPHDWHLHRGEELFAGWLDRVGARAGRRAVAGRRGAVPVRPRVLARRDHGQTIASACTATSTRASSSRGWTRSRCSRARAILERAPMGGKTISTSETKIEALQLQSSAYGVTIPVVGGKTRIAGNLIYQTDFKAVPDDHDAGRQGRRRQGPEHDVHVHDGAAHGPVPRPDQRDPEHLGRQEKVQRRLRRPDAADSTTESFAISAGSVATVAHAAAFSANVSVTGTTRRGTSGRRLRPVRGDAVRRGRRLHREQRRVHVLCRGSRRRRSTSCTSTRDDGRAAPRCPSWGSRCARHPVAVAGQSWVSSRHPARCARLLCRARVRLRRCVLAGQRRAGRESQFRGGRPGRVQRRPDDAGHRSDRVRVEGAAGRALRRELPQRVSRTRCSRGATTASPTACSCRRR